MINIQQAIKEAGLKSKMILQVHDELVFDAYKPEVDELTSLIEKHMVEAVDLDVPMAVEAGVGENWLQAH